MTKQRTDAEVPCGTPVERPVRPCAWLARRIDWPKGKWEPFNGENPPHWADGADPLYSQAALDAAVAAEREMWRKMLVGPHLYRGDCPDGENWHARDPKCKACRALGDWKA